MAGAGSRKRGVSDRIREGRVARSVVLELLDLLPLLVVISSTFS